SDTATPRSSRGGSAVTVARRPPSATAFNVVAACPRAALTALGAPSPVISRTSTGQSPVRVEHLRRAVVADALGLLRARGREHAGAPSRGELDESPPVTPPAPFTTTQPPLSILRASSSA